LRVNGQQPSQLLELYFSRRDAIARFLAARLGNRQEAEDVLQELFLKLDRNVASEEVRDPAAYLFRMAANLARDHRRERQRAHTREADWADVQSMVAGSDIVEDAPSAEAAYGAKQRLAAIRAALDELSPQCRRVFTLHKFDGLSHEEVAKQAGISRSTVEKHMHTALKHLIERLGRD
jgi:RNA polymerase sigma factor (sigma-70 family)